MLQETLTPVAGRPPHQLVRGVSAPRGLVRLARSDYSVPAALVGERVYVEASATKILICTRDLVVAEHARATVPGQKIEAPVHVRERWQRSLVPRHEAPPRGCHIRFVDTVEQRPLTTYAEVAS